MIRNRLSELLAERGLKNARVARDIKSLSRNTINATTSNRGKMIQLETVNTLCRYLGIEPGEFFEYLPFDVKITVSSDDDFYLCDDFINAIDSGIETSSDRFYMPRFYLNLYIEKQKGNLETGAINHVFSLSAILDEDIIFNEKVDDNGNYYLEPSTDTVFRVVLGNPPNEIKDEEKKAFLKFWNKELTPGFRREITDNIDQEIYSFLEQTAYKAPGINWSNKVFNVLYDFNSIVELNVDSSPQIKRVLRDDELPF